MSKSTSATGETTTKRPQLTKPHKKLGTPCFVDLLGNRDETFFIDKSLLIKAFLTGYERVLVVAPRRFGKTILIGMLRLFLENQVEFEKETSIERTSNYILFSNSNLRIMEKTDIVKAHFGRYPVISVSFQCEFPITSYKDALAYTKRTIQRAFEEHQYLKSSVKLLHAEKEMFQKWLSGNVDRFDVIDGLSNLAKCLFLHFDRKVALLVDEYDAIIAQAMIGVEDQQELKNIIQDCTAIIKTTVKQKPFVGRAFITGTTAIAGMNLSDSNIECYKFLEDHNFVDFYGLTSEEAEELMRDVYQLSEKQISFAKETCNGYKSLQGKTIYNMWSLLKYAAEPDNKNFKGWADTSVVVGLRKATYAIQAIKEIIDKELLVFDYRYPIGFIVDSVVTVDDICVLSKIVTGRELKDVKSRHIYLFFSFLVEQGYLTYLDSNKDTINIPNKEIKQQFFMALYYEQQLPK